MEYRKDIDGLRALAVMAILLFHIDPHKLTGGFVGVDVFFVISGFLITNHLQSSLTSKRFSFSEFYIKRIRRLLPALLVMLTGTSIIAYFILLPSELIAYAGSLLATSVYLSNFFFLSQSGYFDNSAETSPLLHTWSLGVEEQFYILFPILLYLIHKFRKQWLTKALIVIGICSFILSVWLVQIAPDAAFFISPSRFWQFICGSLAAITVADKKFTKHIMEILYISGLALILYSIYFFSAANLFPGFNALIPTIGTTLMIFAAKHSSPLISSYPARFFPARIIGQASYSIYLWHWPLIVFYKMEVNSTLSYIEQGSLVLMSIILGIVSWILIETPTRKICIKKYKHALYAGTIGCAFFAFLFFGTVTLSRGMEKRYPDEALKYASYLNYNMEEEARENICFLTSNAKSVNQFDQSRCINISEDRENVVLLGDSHNAHLFKASSELLNTVSLSQINASGCKPYLGSTGRKTCTDLMKLFFEEYLKKYSFNTVIISARWKLNDLDKLMKTILFLQQKDIRVIVIGPVPEYELALPKLMAKSVVRSDPSLLDTKRDKSIFETNDAFKKELLEKGVDYVSPINILCSSMSCTTSVNGTPVQFDYGHFTSSGAAIIAYEISEYF